MTTNDKIEKLITQNSPFGALNDQRYFAGVPHKKHNLFNIKTCTMLTFVFFYIGCINQSQDILFAAAAFTILALLTTIVEMTKVSNYGWSALLWGIAGFFQHALMLTMIICHTVGVPNPSLYTICMIIYCWMAFVVLSFEIETNQYQGESHYRVITKTEMFENGSKYFTILTFMLIILDVINYRNQGMSISALTCSACACILKIVDDMMIWSKAYACTIVSDMFAEKLKNFKNYYRATWIPMRSLKTQDTMKTDIEASPHEDLQSRFSHSLRNALRKRSSFEILSRWWGGADCNFEEPDDLEWMGMLFKIACNFITNFLLVAFAATYFTRNSLAVWIPSLLLMIYMMMASINIHNPKKLK